MQSGRAKGQGHRVVHLIGIALQVQAICSARPNQKADIGVAMGIKGTEVNVFWSYDATRQHNAHRTVLVGKRSGISVL